MQESSKAAGERGRWQIAWLLGAGVLVNYFDRVNLSVAHDALLHSFRLSDVGFGYLLSAYSWTYAAMQLPSGVLLDRFGVRRVMLVGIVLWAVASAGAVMATTVMLFFASRLLLGIGEAPTFPANAKAIGHWFPQEERSVPTAIFDAAAKLSIGIGTPVLGLLLLRFGWHASFLATAALSAVYAMVFAAVYREPSLARTQVTVPAAIVNTAGVALGTALGTLIRQKKVIGLALGSAAYNYSFYLLLTWLPFYVASAFHLGQARSVLFAGAPWIFAAVADFVIGGWLVDLLIRRGRDANHVRRTVLTVGTTLGLCILAPAHVTSPRVAVLWLSLALGGLSAAAPVLWSIPSLIAPPNSTGRVGAIMNLANQISAIAAPIVTGYILHRQHSFAGAFNVAGAFLICGIAGYVLMLGAIKPLDVQANAPAV